jgi:hypothetical protein
MTEIPTEKDHAIVVTILIRMINWSFPLWCKVSRQRSQQGSWCLMNTIPDHALLWLLIALSLNLRPNALPIWNEMLFLASISSGKQGTRHNRLIFCAWFPKASQMRNKFWNIWESKQFDSAWHLSNIMWWHSLDWDAICCSRLKHTSHQMMWWHRCNDIGPELWYWFRYHPKDSKGNDAMRGEDHPQSYFL